MESSPSHPLLQVLPEDVKSIYQFYNMTDQNDVKQCLDNIMTWCSKQDHLQEAYKYLTLDPIKRLFVLARCSTEGTKMKIDKIFTSRGLMPEMFLNRTVKEFESLWNCVNHCPLPIMAPNQSRILATQFKNDNFDDFNIQSYFRYAFLVGEFRLFYEYHLSETIILDLKHVHMGVLSKLNPVIVKKAEILCTEGFGTKIKGIHILNAPPFVDKVVFLLKQALREKVASRLHVHNSYEDFHKYVPRELLPSDYGGDQLSMTKLSEQWIEVFKSKDGQMKMHILENFVTDETKRKNSKFNEEYLGMPGSFRQLSVD